MNGRRAFAVDARRGSLTGCPQRRILLPPPEGEPRSYLFAPCERLDWGSLFVTITRAATINPYKSVN
jgi:hypothetical protein